MIQNSEIWAEYRIGAGNYQTFMFKVDNTQKNFQIYIDASVLDSNLDLLYVLCSYDDFKKLKHWWTNRTQYKRDSKGNIMKDKDGNSIIISIPEPPTNKIINRRTNILEKTLSLEQGFYTLILDNQYSVMKSKGVWLHIKQTWGEFVAPKQLPIVQEMINEIPHDIATCINDANNCYVSGHYNQSSIMFRKSIELAIKIKLQQSGIDNSELSDGGGNELNLSAKTKLLKKHRLITNRSASDLEKIKWFGDVGAHGTMKVTEQDIKDIEPKVRSFLVGLNLET